MWLPAKASGAVPGDMFICLSLPDEQMPGAERAVAQWAKSLEQWKTLHAVREWDVTCDIIVRETRTSHPTVESALAWVNEIGGNRVYMKRGRYERDVEGILLHELGHALGAQHIEGTLMARVWEPGAYVCPDSVTVAQVAAHHGINLDTLTWCY
jgi:hypothetical protein